MMKHEAAVMTTTELIQARRNFGSNAMTESDDLHGALAVSATSRKGPRVMKRLLRVVRSMRLDRKGVTALEYALIGSIVAVGIVVKVTSYAAQLQTTFTGFTSALSSSPAK
jgi:Flp pilus assembly pilin Flp